MMQSAIVVLNTDLNKIFIRNIIHMRILNNYVIV